MSAMKVSELFIYPLKSAQGVTVNSVNIQERGPQYDRRWMLVDNHGQFITQREFPRLCLIAATVDDVGQLILNAAGMQPMVVVGGESSLTQVKIWNDEVGATDCGDDVANWLSQFLDVSCRLVYMPEKSRRRVDSDYAFNKEIVGFSDGFPLMLISQASLDELNSRLSSSVLMNRFRPNIVVTDCKPFAEDTWQSIAIGDLVFDVAKPCSRCVIPSIDQHSAIKYPEVIRVLASYRRRQGKVYFGQHLIHRAQGDIATGDTVTVLK